MKNINSINVVDAIMTCIILAGASFLFGALLYSFVFVGTGIGLLIGAFIIASGVRPHICNSDDSKS